MSIEPGINSGKVQGNEDRETGYAVRMSRGESR